VVDTLVKKRGAELALPPSGRIGLGAAVGAALTAVVTWQRNMIRLFAPLSGSAEAQVNLGPDGACGASLERRLAGFLIAFETCMEGHFKVILTGHTRLGAGAANDMVFSDKHVSTHHAHLFVDPDTVEAFVEDEASMNGTFVNEERVEPGERRQLKDDDFLRLGASTFIVKLFTVDHRGVGQVSYPYR
jgi:hypothetical protein